MCFQNVDFNDVDDNTTRWLCTLTYENIYVCDYDRSEERRVGKEC